MSYLTHCANRRSLMKVCIAVTLLISNGEEFWFLNVDNFDFKIKRNLIYRFKKDEKLTIINIIWTYIKKWYATNVFWITFERLLD